MYGAWPQLEKCGGCGCDSEFLLHALANGPLARGPAPHPMEPSAQPPAPLGDEAEKAAALPAPLPAPPAAAVVEKPATPPKAALAPVASSKKEKKRVVPPPPAEEVKENAASANPPKKKARQKAKAEAAPERVSRRRSRGGGAYESERWMCGHPGCVAAQVVHIGGDKCKNVDCQRARAKFGVAAKPEPLEVD